MIELIHISKTFHKVGVTALDDVNLTINDGEIYGIIGLSGAGKSTLVRCINLLEEPSEGTILVDGINLRELSPAQLRAKKAEISMIFQGFNLLSQKNCLQNVMLPLLMKGVSRREAAETARDLLTRVGLGDRCKSYPAQLSGGQKQRVAIARALATKPKILLCDEATSALDPSTTKDILCLLKELRNELGLTVVIITHQMNVIEEICDTVAILDNGKLAEVGEVGTVFANPKSSAALKLVCPDDLFPVIESNHLLRLVFMGSVSDTPLIAELAKKHNIIANIMGASTKVLSGRVYGNMLIKICGSDEDYARAIDILSNTIGLTVKEVSNV